MLSRQVADLWDGYAQDWPLDWSRGQLYDALLAEQLRCPAQWEAATRIIGQMQEEGIKLQPEVCGRVRQEPLKPTGSRPMILLFAKTKRF
jgi:hypothetical protein